MSSLVMCGLARSSSSWTITLIRSPIDQAVRPGRPGVLYSAGTMELLFRLAPAQQQGQYGAFYGISNGLMSSLAPAVLGAAIAVSGGWGWWLLAGATFALSVLLRAVARGAGPVDR